MPRLALPPGRPLRVSFLGLTLTLCSLLNGPDVFARGLPPTLDLTTTPDLASETQRQTSTHTLAATVSLSSARQKAAREGKVLFVDFTASWCLPCRLMEETVFSDPAVLAYLREHYVSIQIDIENFDGLAIQQQYGVESLPTMLVFASTGEEIDRIQGAVGISELLVRLRQNNTPANRKIVPGPAPEHDWTEPFARLVNPYADVEASVAHPAIPATETTDPTNAGAGSDAVIADQSPPEAPAQDEQVLANPLGSRSKAEVQHGDVLDTEEDLLFADESIEQTGVASAESHLAALSPSPDGPADQAGASNVNDLHVAPTPVSTALPEALAQVLAEADKTPGEQQLSEEELLGNGAPRHLRVEPYQPPTTERPLQATATSLARHEQASIVNTAGVMASATAQEVAGEASLGTLDDRPATASAATESPCPARTETLLPKVYSLQAGVFTNQDNAIRVARNLGILIAKPVLIELDAQGVEPVYRLYVGRFTDLSEAQQTGAALLAVGYPSFMKELVVE